MNWDKLSELCQCAALLALVANDMLLLARVRAAEKKLKDLRYEEWLHEVEDEYAEG